MIQLLDLGDGGGDLRNIVDADAVAVDQRVVIPQRIEQHLIIRHTVFQIFKRLFFGIKGDAGNIFNLGKF